MARRSSTGCAPTTTAPGTASRSRSTSSTRCGGSCGAVPLVPVADAIDWYDEDAGLFADARSRAAYEQAHIAGAVFSPAPDGLPSDDPVEALAEDARVVTYCGCPHHLSTLRGASLIRVGYVNTYAIDEGFFAWADAGYPLDGDAVESMPEPFTIEGRTDPAESGETAWAWHDPSGQREAAPIGAAGRFTLHLRFYGVTPDSPIRLSTPVGEVSRTLGTLAGNVVDV